MVDYLIVGAGLFGATCARTLTNAGLSCLVIDKRDHIAGNIYTETKDDVDIHIYGPHIFHTDSEEVWEFVNKYSEFVPFTLNTLANFNNKLYHLPFNLTTMYELFGTYNINEINKIIEKEKNEYWESTKNDPQIWQNGQRIPNCLESEAIENVGVTVFETLIKGYTEKQWGKKCKDLHWSIINRLPVRNIFDNNYFNDRFQGMPKYGYTKMVENILEGIPVLLNQDYLDNIDYWNTQAKHVIYCGAVDELCNYELGELEWRSLRFDHQTIKETDNVQGTPVMNYTSASVPYTRIIEHKWFLPRKFGPKSIYKDKTQTFVTYEYPDKWDKTKERYYAVFNDKTEKLYRNYCELLKMKYPNIILGGRLGFYRYFDMDDTIINAWNVCSDIFGDKAPGNSKQ